MNRENKNMDINDVAKFIDDDLTFARGKHYYDEGRVLGFSMLDGNITATVTGSKPRPYSITIKVSGTKPPMAYCSCPWARKGFICKHIAAVLIHYISISKASNPIIKDGGIFSPDKTRNLTEDISPWDRDCAIRIISAIEKSTLPPNTENTTTKNRMVFVIEQSRYEGPNHYISLKMQYIRKNGKHGRTSKFNRDLITEKISDDKLVLIHRLLDQDRHRDYFHRHFDYLLRSEISNLFIEEDGELKKASFEEFSYVKISFELDESYEFYSTFSPRITLIGKNEHLIDSTCFAEFDGAKTFFITGGGLILYNDKDPCFSALFKELNYSERGYTHKEIEEMKTLLLDSQNRDKIKIEFDVERVRTTYPVPKPILEIESDYSGIKATLIFDYCGTEISFSNRRQRLAAEKRDCEYIVAMRNDRYESDVCKFINSFDCFSRTHIYHYDADFISHMDIQDFLIEQGEKLIEHGIDIRVKGQKTKVTSSARVKIKAKHGIDWFDIEATIEEKDGSEKKIQLDPTLFDKGIIRSTGTLVYANKEDLERLKRLLSLGLDMHGRLRVSKHNLGLLDQLYDDVSNSDSLEASRELFRKLKDFTKIKKQPTPKQFAGKLRDYQSAGLNWLHFLNAHNLSGCLADDMGLGKTIQALALLQSLKEKKILSTSLIVVPVTTLANWENELKTFTPKIKFRIHAGTGRRQGLDIFKGSDIVIVSYQTLRSDIEYFAAQEFDYVILDEAQNIKNCLSQTFKAIKSLKSRHRLSLTGTPVENNTLELWSQMEFLNPGLLGNLTDYKREFALPIESLGDEAAADRLRKMIFPFILRRKKEDVAKELPDKTISILYSEMDNRQAEIYAQHKKRCRENLEEKLAEDGVEGSAIEIFAALLKLRQIAIFPQLANPKFSDIPSAKFDLLKDTIDEILEEDHKILIFSQFVDSLKIIESHLKKMKIKYSYLDGSVSSLKRKDEIVRFQNEEDTKIFLLSLKAGGVGINLTSADYVILFDPWWNPATEAQAIDRAHRIGQSKKVIAYKMITKNTVEEKIVELQNRKQALVENLITADTSFFKSLSKKDILDLFS